jgi:hypothetical protein
MHNSQANTLKGSIQTGHTCTHPAVKAWCAPNGTQGDHRDAIEGGYSDTVQGFHKGLVKWGARALKSSGYALQQGPTRNPCLLHSLWVCQAVWGTEQASVSVICSTQRTVPIEASWLRSVSHMLRPHGFDNAGVICVCVYIWLMVEHSTTWARNCPSMPLCCPLSLTLAAGGPRYWLQRWRRKKSFW